MSDDREAVRHISTLPPERLLRQVRRDRFGRRVFTVALAVFLALGVLGLYGVRTGEKNATGGGYQLTVTYTKISRPGLATPWAVEIRRPGGFGDDLVTVAVTAAYFDAFDENGLDPDPAESFNDGERSVWRFEPPPGDVMTVSFDARIEPGVQLKTVKGTVAVLDPSDAAVASVDFKTLVLP
ncbi:MAG: hypothetical protein QOE93_1620 [Actinomycetota bacterium]|jgi:hypothetical protein|nr:hypothetical protein [Actinomycetota bacterium]